MIAFLRSLRGTIYVVASYKDPMGLIFNLIDRTRVEEFVVCENNALISDVGKEGDVK